MSTYRYKIMGEDKKISESEMEAKDKNSLIQNIKKDGVTIISVEEIKSGGGMNLSGIIPFLNKVKSHDKIIFARNLGQMIEAGLPITRALSIMERQAKQGKFKKVLNGLNDSLSKGVPLSEAMKDYSDVFSNLFISMVKAGEESGNMSQSLKTVANQMEKSEQLTKKIKGAMMYPAVIFSLMIVIGVLMMIYMVPTLTNTFIGLGIKLPLSTRIIIGISNFLKSYYIFVIFGLIISFILGSLAFKSKRGGRIFDFVLIHLPIIGTITKEMNSARTARTLASLISSGVDIVLAISVTKDVIQNSYYKEILDQIQTTIQKGDPISSIFLENEKLYPLFVGEMVSVGEETGKVGDMLSGVAQFYEEEVDQKTKDMSSIIEPILMIIIGVAVGIFAISMLGPTYSLADSI